MSARRRLDRNRLAWCALIACVWPSVASAQPAMPLPGRLLVAAGVRWASASTISSVAATETTAAGGRFQLFATETSIASALGINGRFGIRLTRSIDAEASASFAKPELRTRVSADVENAAGFTASESVNEMTIEGSFVLHLGERRFGARAIPYLSAGAGFLGDLHEGGTLAENGAVVHAGGGLDYPFKTATNGAINTLGVRVDGRALFRSGGVSLDDAWHVSPAVLVSMFARF